MNKALCLAAPLAVALCGCAPQAEPGDSELKATLTALQARVAQLEKQSERQNLLLAAETTAYLTPGNQGYSVVQTELGPLTVNLEAMRPAENGTQVTLRFGNLANATLDRVKATIEWGKSDQGFTSEASGSKRETFTRSFPRGQWVDVNLLVEGLRPEEIAFIRVKDVDPGAVSLLGLPTPAARAQD